MSADLNCNSLYNRLSPYIVGFLVILLTLLASWHIMKLDSFRQDSKKQEQAQVNADRIQQLEAQLALMAANHAGAIRTSDERLKKVNELTKKNLDIETKHKALEGKHTDLQNAHATLKTKAKSVATNNIGRTVRAVNRRVAGAAGESIPVVGVSVIAALVAVDVIEACDAMREMESLSGPEDGIGSKITEICKQHVPTSADLVVKVKDGWRRAYDTAMSHVPVRQPLSISPEIVTNLLKNVPW
jgi:hypothetical protein